MTEFLPYIYGFISGAACMGGWWWWINHRAKARAAVAEVVSVAKKL